ncbi:hypothetical protein ACIQUM_19570 [Amycolatopsis azurea]|uniref:hypothetical protein n=1 Tax=Amycolatopsis azurea TaxID=36819 RepID=UPI0038034F46
MGDDDLDFLHEAHCHGGDRRCRRIYRAWSACCPNTDSRAVGDIVEAVSDPWLRIEVLDGEIPASAWRRANAEVLLDAAIADRAVRWSWRVHDLGVVFEVAFRTEQIRDEFCRRISVKEALEAAPDPRRGLTVKSGGGD